MSGASSSMRRRTDAARRRTELMFQVATLSGMGERR
jgi:hypothetical protein